MEVEVVQEDVERTAERSEAARDGKRRVRPRRANDEVLGPIHMRREEEPNQQDKLTNKHLSPASESSWRALNNAQVVRASELVNEVGAMGERVLPNQKRARSTLSPHGPAQVATAATGSSRTASRSGAVAHASMVARVNRSSDSR
jgi:hypothetical protein